MDYKLEIVKTRLEIIKYRICLLYALTYKLNLNCVNLEFNQDSSKILRVLYMISVENKKLFLTGFKFGMI